MKAAVWPVFLITFSFLPDTFAQEVPTKLDLREGSEFVYSRSIKIVLDLEGTQKDEKVSGQQIVSMDLKFKLAFEKAKEGFRLKLSIQNEKLALEEFMSAPSEETRKTVWELPEGCTIELELTMDRQGVLVGTYPDLREVLKSRGCDSRIVKIPDVYFAESPGRLRALEGPLLGSVLLPGNSSRDWELTLKRTYGAIGLLDDFSCFEENWKWAVDSQEGGNLRLKGVLSDLKVAKAFGKDKIKILEKNGTETAWIDQKTGLVQTTTGEYWFKYHYQGQGGDLKGKITRTEKVALSK